HALRPPSPRRRYRRSRPSSSVSAVRPLNTRGSRPAFRTECRRSRFGVMMRGDSSLPALAKSETSGLSQDLDNHALPPLAVPFAIEPPLPRTEVKPAVGDRHDNLMAYRQAAQVGGRVVLPRVVVPVAGGVPGGDRRLEPVENVVPQSRLVIVDEDR